MIIEPFTAEHYERLKVQSSQVAVADFFTAEHVAGLVRTRAFAAVLEDGTIVGCGGAFEFWPDRAQLWALVAGQTAEHFVQIHRAVERFLTLLPHKRVEATVQADFKQGHRWMRMLGFQCETPNGMVAFSPDGTTHYQYARIRP